MDSRSLILIDQKSCLVLAVSLLINEEAPVVLGVFLIVLPLSCKFSVLKDSIMLQMFGSELKCN